MTCTKYHIIQQRGYRRLLETLIFIYILLFKLSQANNDGSKDTEIFGRLCDIEDAIKDINEQINTPFVPRPPRQGGSFGGGSRFNQGGPRSFNGQQGDYGKQNWNELSVDLSPSINSSRFQEEDRFNHVNLALINREMNIEEHEK